MNLCSSDLLQSLAALFYHMLEQSSVLLVKSLSIIKSNQRNVRYIITVNYLELDLITVYIWLINDDKRQAKADSKTKINRAKPHVTLRCEANNR